VKSDKEWLCPDRQVK